MLAAELQLPPLPFAALQVADVAINGGVDTGHGQHPFSVLSASGWGEAEAGMETALDRYVNRPDPSFRYSLAATTPFPGGTTYLVDMTSQSWRGPDEVNQTLWQHWLQIIVPDNAVSDTGILTIGGGNNSSTPPSVPAEAAALAAATGMVTVYLPTVPNQPLTFAGDPDNPRREDAILAYSYNEFLEGGDEEWPAILPMVKSAVRAMDTTQEFLDDQIAFDINDFVVTGGSKRGWTTWLTAAVDERVSAIAPTVIDVLNIDASMANHRENYDGVTERIIGGYAEAVGDYTAFGIFDRGGTPRGQELMSIIDPYAYRDRLTMPKYIINSTGDQFFTPDSSLFYFQDLVGPSYLRYVPNTDHSLRQDTTVLPGIAAFFAAVDRGVSLPELDWTFEGEFQNTIRLTTPDNPLSVNLWQATNPDSLDFRLNTAAPRYTATPLSDQGGGVYVGTVPVPDSGGTAFFVEATYLVGGVPLTLTTQARIVEAMVPELLGIRPDAGPLLNDGDTLHVAPREFNLLFAGGANLNAQTISTDTAKLIRSGGDGTFTDGNEIEVALGYVGLPDPRVSDPADLQQIVLRPASYAIHNAVDPRFAFPDDHYQLHIIGSGENPLASLGGAPFAGGVDSITQFRLDLGAQVVAVSPQPIDLATRTQASNEIVVHFDDQLLDSADATNVNFYRLVNTAATRDLGDDQTTFPESVSYDPLTATAVLRFASDIPAGTYRLDIGRDDDLLPVELPLNTLPGGSLFGDDDQNTTFVTAIDIGMFDRQTVTLSAQIEPQSIPLPPRPGSEDDPGNRQIQREQHIAATGTDPVLPSGITVMQYHFPPTFGTDPSGNPYTNLISEAEKQIVREIFEIYARLSGFEFVETTAGGTRVGKGDLRSLVPSMGPDSGVAGLGGPGSVLLNAAVFSDSTRYFGDSFTDVMVHEIGHALGLGHAYDQPANMGAGVPNDVLPGDHDVVHLQRIVPPNSTDVDMYRFQLDEPGRIQVETIAERLANVSLLNSALRLYRQTANDFELVAQNDQYFGADAYIDVTLDPGTYFVGVTSTGNTQYDPRVPDSGYGGTTDGHYQLRMTFDPLRPHDWMRDADGTAIDGDGDGRPGGVYSFWFQASDPATTIYVDKANDATANVDGSGALSDPFDNVGHALGVAGSRIVVPDDGAATIADGQTFVVDDGIHRVTFQFGSGGDHPIDLSSVTTAEEIAGAIADAINNHALLAADTAAVAGRVVQLTGIEQLDVAGTPALLHEPNLIRVLGNVGDDGDLATLADNDPYLIGLDMDGFALEDGAEFLVPQGVTVMIEAGALLKLRRANLDAGTSAVGIDRRGGAIQLLGTPNHHVYLRSYHDDSVGGNSDGPGPGATPGDFGGVVFRNDSDLEAAGIFLNHVNHAEIRHGGGKVFVGAQESVYSPVHLIDARPTVSFNYLVASDDSAISASPDSFEETNRRIGPDVVGNFLVDNTIDGMFIRVVTPLGSTLRELTVAGRLDDTDITHVLTENLIINGGAGGPTDFGVLRARPSGRLLLDPGTVLKLSDARIEAERGGGALIAEGTADRPVIFTSLADDRFGGGGSFDTDSTPAGTRIPQPGDWGGLYLGAGTSGNLDHASILFGGGITPIEGNAAQFNAIEVHQADFRLANSLLQYNADGNASTQRNGRGANFPAVIYVRAAQPIILDNELSHNAGPAININANSLRWEVYRDPGRSTGFADPYWRFDDNHGPLVRLNRLDDNQINGMVVRGEELTTESIWDDTDIAHVVFNEIFVDNLHHVGGLTLQSGSSESLVVKLAGQNAGFRATGTPQEIIDRVGGTIHVLGTAGHPVVLTHLGDDTVGAGFSPTGEVVFDTDNSGPTSGQSGGWRGLVFDEYSNDRNVGVVRELENPLTGGREINRTPLLSQPLGTLAPNEKSGDENRRLGFDVTGFISPDDPRDIDVYNFNATAGTPIWIDIDRTDPALDAIVEVLNENGIVLARSLRSGDPLLPGTLSAGPLRQEFILGGDHYTQNFRDPGFYYVLPGNAGEEGTYFVRVRSNPASAGSVNVLAGESRGVYTLQIRLGQIQEFPGSTVKFADIRYADIGIDVRGLPARSPLVGEAGELPIDNDTAANSQVLINLLESDMAAISIAGTLSLPAEDGEHDVDWYTFDLQQTGVQVIEGFNDSSGTVAVVFDLDYADSTVGPDTSVAVYQLDEELAPRLVYFGRESNITDDQPVALAPPLTSITDLGRGSLGKRDPFIGPVHLDSGSSYLVAVMSNAHLPAALSGVFQALPETNANALVRLEPVNSVTRVVEDRLESPTIDTYIQPLTLRDVTLYVASGAGPSGLFTVDPFAAAARTVVTNDFSNIQDIVIRTDGRMFGYRSLPNDSASIGELIELDPETGEPISQQPDNILTRSPTPNVADIDEAFGTPNERAEHFTTSDAVDAFTFRRLGSSSLGEPTYDVYYAVRESETSSKLYRARDNGDATAELDDDENLIYGILGDIQPAGVIHASLLLSVTDISQDPPPQTDIRIESKLPGSAGNEIVLDISVTDTDGAQVTDIEIDAVNNLTIILLEVGGIDGTPATAAELVDAINLHPQASQLVTAVVVGDGEDGDGALDTVVLGISPERQLSGGSDDSLVEPLAGRVTGLSFGNFFSTGNLYGVTSAGEFIEIDPKAATVLNRVNTSIDGFTGLTLGPQNVESGSYANTLFATTDDGRLVAFDTFGNLVPVFSGGTSVIPLQEVTGSTTGLAFSPLDFNLWHPTFRRGTPSPDDFGHGVDPTPDNTRERLPGAQSLHFGLEQWIEFPTDNYVPYNGNAQFGILTPEFHADLTSNPDIGDNYNLPGGAQGSIITSPFSLSGANRFDRPTLYFNYFLETEDHSGSNVTTDIEDPFRDSARAFVSRDGGLTWELVATSNSQLSGEDPSDSTLAAELPGFLSHLSDAGLNSATPRAASHQIVQELFDNSGVWRQARIDLSTFAGEPDLRLRFDFSTAGAMGDPSLGATDANFGELTSDTRSITSLNNAFEGFYIDDIIVGFAERGEMVTGVVVPDASIINLATSPRTTNLDPNQYPEILFGDYQLEIRRTGEYIDLGDPLNTIRETFDTNARHTREDDTTGLMADRNRARPQGAFVLDSNFISASATVGINVSPATQRRGLINFPMENTERLVPGVVIQNNVIVGHNGIRITGYDTFDGNAPVAFDRVVNNTLVGTFADSQPTGTPGVGIAVSGLASPTLLNNLLTDYVTAIVDGGIGTVIRANFFQDNDDHGAVGTDHIIGPNGAPLFLDRAAGNFILQPSSLAIDSSQDTEQDRFFFRSFKQELGIPPSPIFAPDRDVYGQLRVDSATFPGGFSTDVFKDRGAVDRSDTDQPYAVLLTPVDNDDEGQDRNPANTIVHLRDGLLEEFTLRLGDGRWPLSPFEGTGVAAQTVFDPANPNVIAQAITVLQDGRLLRPGTDYTVGYNPQSGLLMLTPLATLWDDRSVYVIRLDNAQIADKQGNRLRPNQSDGTTMFTIIMPATEFDFGDAPASYGTLLSDRAAYHSIGGANPLRLGALIDGEADGQPGNLDDVNGVDDEDGLLVGTLQDDSGPFTVFHTPGADPNDVQPDEVIGFLNPDDPDGSEVHLFVTGTGLLDGWIDFDQSGTFDPDERVFDSLPVIADAVTGEYLTLNVQTPADALAGPTWLRLRLSETFGLAPTGFVIGGEVEDYPVTIHRFGTVPDGQNEPPTFELPDAIIELAERDDESPVVLDGFAVNIYPGDPSSLNETITQGIAEIKVEKISGPAGLMVRDPELDQDGRLTLFPTADAVGSFEYAVTLADDHPTDPQSTTQSFTVHLRPINDPLGISPAWAGSSGTHPDDGEISYQVAPDGTITYTLREDEPLFIPMRAETTAVRGLGLAGDSLTDEYINEPYGQYALNWASLVGQYRSQELPLGEFRPPPTSPPSSFDAPWGDLRRAGYEYNWALAGATSFTLLEPDPVPPLLPNPIGQHLPLADAINDGFVSHAVLAIGQNDFSRFSPATQGIYNGTWTEAQIVAHSDQVLANIEEALKTINIGNVKLVMSNIIDYDAAPAYRAALPDPVRRTLVTERVDALNDRIEALALAHGVPVVDSFRFTKDLLSGASFSFGGVEIANQQGIDPTNAFVDDGIHPHTIPSAIVANSFLHAVNEFYDTNLTLFSEQEVMDIVGLPYVTDTFALDYADYLMPPEPSGPPSSSPFVSVGLLDVFHVGPANEAGSMLGGSQAVSWFGSWAPGETQHGGRLEPVIDDTDQLIGWNYFPPFDFNSNLGIDFFEYQVTDGGMSWDFDSGTLIDDAHTRSGRVEFLIAPVNDAPVFTLAHSTVSVAEDAGFMALDGVATGIGAGPLGTADDENDPPAAQTVSFMLTPVGFDPADSFVSPPQMDAQTGQLFFENVPDVWGSYLFEVRLQDNGALDPSRGDQNLSPPQLLTIEVLAVNDPPTLGPLANLQIEENALQQTVPLAGISAGGGESQPLRVTAVSSNPALVAPIVTYTSPATTGTIAFTPPADQSGTATITVTVEDGGLDGDLDTVSDNASIVETFVVTINPVNDLPTLAPLDNLVIDEDAPVQTVSLSGISAGGGESQPLRVTAVSNNPGLIAAPLVSYNSADPTGLLLFAPVPNASGTATITVTVTDGGLDGNLATTFDNGSVTHSFTVTVRPVNDPPRIDPVGDLVIDEDAGPQTVSLTGINAGGGETQPLRVTATSSNPALIPDPVVAYTSAQTLGTLTLQPAADQFGTATVTVTVADAGLDGNLETSADNGLVSRTFTVTVNSVNDPPTFRFSGTDPLVVAEDSGPYAETIFTAIAPGPANESEQTVAFTIEPFSPAFNALFSELPTIDEAGVLRFTTAANLHTDNALGPVPLRVRATDSAGGQSDWLEFQLRISEVNDPPVAMARSLTTDENRVLIIDGEALLIAGSDPDLLTHDDEVISIQLTALQSDAGATLSFDPVTKRISYDPTAVESLQMLTSGQSVTDSFSYTLMDAAGVVSNVATVTLEVLGVNDPPTAVDDHPYLEAEGSTAVAVLDNDTDIDGDIDPSSIELTGTPPHGAAVVQPNGIVLYTPHVDIPVIHTFQYTVADTLGRRSAPATVTFQIDARPEAGHDFAFTPMGQPILLNVISNDFESDGEINPASIEIISGPGGGTATPHADGTISYVPAADFVGVDQFTYRVADLVGRESNLASVEIAVGANYLQNPRDRFDVNNDGGVTALDALLVLNQIFRGGEGDLEILPTQAPLIGINANGDPIWRYYDVNGDDRITAADALQVVNRLAHLGGESEPELPPSAIAVAASGNAEGELAESGRWESSPIVTGPQKQIDTSLPGSVSPDVIEMLARDRAGGEEDDPVTAVIDELLAQPW